MTERKRVKAHRRAKLYRKAHNILKNNVPTDVRYAFTPLTVKMAPKMVWLGRKMSKRPVKFVFEKAAENK